MEKYFYLCGILLFVPLWLYLYSKKEKRLDMLFTGLCFGLAGIIIGRLYANLDYWSPFYIIENVPLEDFLYGLIFGGLSSELYEIFMRLKNSEKPVYKTQKKLILIFGVFTAFSFLLIVNILRLNSIIAHIIPPIIVGLVTIIIRKEALKPALINGVLMCLLTLFMFRILLLFYPNLFVNHWHLENLSGIFLLSIPLEEFLFAFVLGFGAANIYEVIFGYKIVSNNPS